ncbi:type VII secretion integral membrane protein EccD [Cryptosporangium phraense]|nr:type VII secretion integral membrane protein EccD [Cryptosporangium phraense]
MCRLTIVGPTTQIELAVPVHIALVDLLPTVLGHLDASLAVSGLAHGGWVLQRLGEDPLDEDLGTAALGLRDGDIICLRPRDDALAPVDFDDLVDGVAVGIRDRSEQWRPEHTRRMLLAVVLPALAVGAFALLLPGAELWRTVAAGVTALVLVGGVAAAARAVGDKQAARLLGVAAVTYAALAGLLLPAIADGTLIGAPQTLAAATLAALCALTTAAAGGVSGPELVSTAVAGALIAIGAGVAIGVPSGAAGGATVTLVLALILGSFVPRIAFRSSGMKMPELPRTTEEFQEGLDPEPAREVIEKTARADRIMTALYAGLAVVCAAALGTMLVDGVGWYPWALVAVASLLLLLHARVLRSARQRLSGALAGSFGLLALAVAGAVDGGETGRLIAPGASVVLVALIVTAAITVPGRRFAPQWGRSAEILHTILAVAVVPIAFGLLGVYTYLRGLGG